jgi:rod shape-determining protein MreC
MLLRKNRLIRRRVIIGLLLAASLTLLTLSFRESSGGAAGAVQRSVLSVTGPATDAVHRVTQPVVDAWNWSTGLINARDENAKLKKQLGQAANNAVRVQEQEQEIKNLQSLLNYTHTIDARSYESVTAAVTANSPSDYRRTIVINVGSNDGVAVNDPVIGPYDQGGALVGRVIAVTGGNAIVRLIVDPQNAVTAADLSGTAKGSVVPSPGDPGMLNMLMVSASEVIHRNDIVVTAGYGGPLEPVLPRGIPIGKVSNTGISDGDTDQTIQITPFVDFEDLSDVLVLKVQPS